MVSVLRRLVEIFWLLAVVLLLDGCTAQAALGREIRINASEFRFEPSEIRVKAGEAVRFVIINTGAVDHEFESDDARIEEVTIPPGRQRVVRWTAPARPGEYSFVCDISGHREAGMIGKIIVE